ncbi:helix-turn-helix domain-containing protein [Nonomuraea dietziae]
MAIATGRSHGFVHRLLIEPA